MAARRTPEELAAEHKRYFLAALGDGVTPEQALGIATLHPATLDIALVCADSIEPARAAAVIVASEQIAFDLARSNFSQTNRSIPTLREALQQRSLRPGRLFTDSNERRDQLRN